MGSSKTKKEFWAYSCLLYWWTGLIESLNLNVRSAKVTIASHIILYCRPLKCLLQLTAAQTKVKLIHTQLCHNSYSNIKNNWERFDCYFIVNIETYKKKKTHQTWTWSGRGWRWSILQCRPELWTGKES